MARLALLVGLVLALGLDVPATAQEAPRWALDSDDLALARICRHEAGFPARRGRGWDHGDDCAAISAVLDRVRAAMEAHRDRTVTIAEAVNAYSRGRIYDRERTDAACDVAWLDETGAEPGCWRGGVPWMRRRLAWLAILEHARAIRSGQVTHRCDSPPLHWGCGERQTARGCRDHERATRAGWQRLACGRTDNWFYRGP